MGVVSEVTRMARGWLAVSNPGYESIISMLLCNIATNHYNYFGQRERSNIGGLRFIYMGEIILLWCI